ncbi:MAG: hypothetical protein KDC09_12850 [Bacteroidales bacterium]|nr:hypothetical protein [Bacteroidales bacterium]
MKQFRYILSLLVLVLIIYSCVDKAEEVKDSLEGSAEKTLSIEPGYKFYTNENNDAYELVVFNPEILSHIYAVKFEEGKKYHISISGEYCGPIYFALKNEAGNVLFTGEQGSISFDRKYIVWTSNTTETMYIQVQYVDNINFHTYEYHLTFEEVNTAILPWQGMEMECSGDWFVTSDNKLGVALHTSSYTKWARVKSQDLNKYYFSVEMSLASGTPDIYTGLAFLGSDDIREMNNMPQSCRELKILGPASWEVWYWSSGGVSRYWGTTATNLNMGLDAWNKLAIDNTQDTLELFVNDEMVDRFRNTLLLGTGLYLVADDQKDDTLFFRNPELTAK